MAGDNREAERLARLSEEEISAALGDGARLASPEKVTVVGLTRASVLIPFVWTEQGWEILFTRRTDRVEKHKGQVSFPGGSADSTDQNPEDTALRETFEEIGVNPLDVRILGRMADFPTFTGFLITPVVGVVNWPLALHLESAEVSRAFTVPLGWMAAEDHYELRPYLRPNGNKEMVVYFNVYDDELVWGVTGRIMLNLIELLKQRAA